MNPKGIVIIALLGVLPIVLSTDTSEVKWYSMPPDEIKLRTFQSPNKINTGNKPKYMDWVDIRNAFRFDPDEPPMAKKVTYFAPENEDYYSEALSFGVIFFIIAGVLAVCIIAYIVMRFLFGGCMGPKNQKAIMDDDKMKWILVLGASTVALAMVITMGVFYYRP